MQASRAGTIAPLYGGLAVLYNRARKGVRNSDSGGLRESIEMVYSGSGSNAGCGYSLRGGPVGYWRLIKRLRAATHVRLLANLAAGVISVDKARLYAGWAAPHLDRHVAPTMLGAAAGVRSSLLHRIRDAKIPVHCCQ